MARGNNAREVGGRQTWHVRGGRAWQSRRWQARSGRRRGAGVVGDEWSPWKYRTATAIDLILTLLILYGLKDQIFAIYTCINAAANAVALVLVFTEFWKIIFLASLEALPLGFASLGKASDFNVAD